MFFRKKRKAPASVPITMPDIALGPGDLANGDPKLQRQQIRNDLRSLMGQGSGLRYLARLVAVSGALGGSYSPTGAEATAYNEGLRRMGLFILGEAQEHAPEILPKLLLLCLRGSAQPEPVGHDERS